jgi:hypothetical protein
MAAPGVPSCIFLAWMWKENVLQSAQAESTGKHGSHVQGAVGAPDAALLTIPSLSQANDTIGQPKAPCSEYTIGLREDRMPILYCL